MCMYVYVYSHNIPTYICIRVVISLETQANLIRNVLLDSERLARGLQMHLARCLGPSLPYENTKERQTIYY